jgi:hypothetical protein
MSRKFGILALALFASLTLAGCASGTAAADDDRRGGFYGGVSGGVPRQ